MNPNKIVLIGMPGSGKTTIGSLVSKKLNIKFVDMDEYIVQKENLTIKDMFAISEDYFRDAETNCARILGGENSIIIATGGGIVKRNENMEHLKKNSLVVFLNRPIENIISDIDISTRPLLKDSIEKIYKLYKERYHLYQKYSDIEIINDTTIDDAVSRITDAFQK